MDEHRAKIDREFDTLLAGHTRELEALSQRHAKDRERLQKTAAAVEARRRRQLQQQQEAELKQFQAQQKKDYTKWKDEMRKVSVRSALASGPVICSFTLIETVIIGLILWGHSGPRCLALSSLSWTSMRRWRATVAACDSSNTW